MRITIESTTRQVTICQNGVEITARVWEGESEKGIPVFALIPLIGVPEGMDQTQFRAELASHQAPSADALAVFPLRMIL